MYKQSGHPVVVAAVVEAIGRDPRQAIGFRDFMELCLYHDPCGYYKNEEVKIGKAGDFYTSSSIGTVFGEVLAGYIAGQVDALPAASPLRIAEWGGGSGRLALHLLDELQLTRPDLYGRLTYTLLETSGFHRALQLAALEQHQAVIGFADEAAWLREPAEDGLFVLANELLDAFAVHRLRYRAGSFEESCVRWDAAAEAVREVWLPLEPGPLLDCCQQAKVPWREGQMFEMNPQAAAWVEAVGARIRSGELLVVDYGDTAAELFAAHRHQGTLMCYRKHQAYDNPFIHLGEQDITSHVNFSACLEAAAQGGFASCSLQTQKQFLLERGVLERLQAHSDPNPFSEAAKKNRAIRQLLLSDQMSELFKVMIAKKKR